MNLTPSAIVAAPKIVTITFAGDPDAAKYAELGAGITSSSWWDAIRPGYCGTTTASCIGDGPAGVAYTVPTPAPSAYTDSGPGNSTLQAFLTGLINSKAVPAPDENTIYTIYLPETTTVTSFGSVSCTAFYGYHYSYVLNGTNVIYALIDECQPSAGVLPSTAFDEATVTTSHEIAEASTDPLPNLTLAWVLDFNNASTRGWSDVQLYEVGDLCDDIFAIGQDLTTANGFTTQRIWSWENANAGKNPCLPIPAGEVYFNTFTNYSVLTLDVGKSVDVEITALADGPMAPWSVFPYDETDPGGKTKYLSFTMSGGTFNDAGNELVMKSGDKATLTVKLLVDPKDAPNGEADAIMVSEVGPSSMPTKARIWPFVVLTPAEAAAGGFGMMAPRKRTAGPSYTRPRRAHRFQD